MIEIVVIHIAMPPFEFLRRLCAHWFTPVSVELRRASAGCLLKFLPNFPNRSQAVILRMKYFGDMMAREKDVEIRCLIQDCCDALTRSIAKENQPQT